MNKPKKLKIFEEYSDGFIYCINRGIRYERVVKHQRSKGSKDWYVILKNGKVLKE